ncbi:MAG: phage tail sheath subtilisin-like domain-containing protein, partial [Gemmatimonadaceae bacterium]
MPVAPSYPGVYIEEVPSGVRTITGVPTSVTAFLGRTSRGPVNAATLVTSYADFERGFGGLAPAFPLTYAVRDFYQNGGSTAVIVRLFNPEDGTGGAQFRVGDQTNGLRLMAASPGTWGNKLRAKIELIDDAEAKKSAGLAPNDTLFNLTVSDGSPGGRSERFLNLVVPKLPADDEKVVRRPDKVFAEESNLVRWDGAWPAATTAERTGMVIAAGTDAVSGKADELAKAEKDIRAKKNDVLAATSGLSKTVLNAYNSAKSALDVATRSEAELKARTAPPPTTSELAAATAATTTATAAMTAAAAAAPALVTAQAALDMATAALATAAQGASTAETAMGGVDSGAVAAQYIGSAANKTGMQALATADVFNLLCIPPDTHNGDTPPAVYQAAMEFCAEHRAMLIVDAPAAWSANRETAAQKAVDGFTDLGLTGVSARNAALYFPRVRAVDPLRGGRVEEFVPCGIIAGVMARTDTQRGVWKAPAGLDATLSAIVGFDATLNDQENGQLNPLGINVLRSFPVYGNVVWGARTLRGADQLADEYKYVPVRRLALYIEESLFRGTKWVVFEPNDEPLWAQIRLNMGAFLHNLFRQGAFQG